MSGVTFHFFAKCFWQNIPRIYNVYETNFWTNHIHHFSLHSWLHLDEDFLCKFIYISFLCLCLFYVGTFTVHLSIY